MPVRRRFRIHKRIWRLFSHQRWHLSENVWRHQSTLTAAQICNRIHSEKVAVRQVFLDGFGNHLFDIKKAVFPHVPFDVGRYKFNGVKSAPDFAKELGIFHFGEVRFHRNDSQGKVATLKAIHNVNYEYLDYVDKEEQGFKNVYSMTVVRKWLKRKASGLNGSSNNNPKPDEGKEEAVKKEQEEITQRLAAGENKLLAEEAQRDKGEVSK